MTEEEFLQSLAIQGAARPDSFSGMNPGFRAGLYNMLSAAPPDIAGQIKVKSGYRSVARQRELWEQALKKYGSPSAARKWVAPPGNSQHNLGFASDLSYASDAARKWAHENAGKYGLSFPLANENWHIELAGARNKGGPRGLAVLDKGLTLTSGNEGARALRDAAALQPAVPPMGDKAPELPASISVESASRPAADPTIGDRLRKSILGDEMAGKLATLTAPATATTPAGPLNNVAGIFGAFMPKSAPRQPDPIQSIIPSVDNDIAQRSQGAQQLMAQLLSSRKRSRG